MARKAGTYKALSGEAWSGVGVGVGVGIGVESWTVMSRILIAVAKNAGTYKALSGEVRVEVGLSSRSRSEVQGSGANSNLPSSLLLDPRMWQASCPWCFASTRASPPSSAPRLPPSGRGRTTRRAMGGRGALGAVSGLGLGLELGVGVGRRLEGRVLAARAASVTGWGLGATWAQDFGARGPAWEAWTATPPPAAAAAAAPALGLGSGSGRGLGLGLGLATWLL